MNDEFFHSIPESDDLQKIVQIIRALPTVKIDKILSDKVTEIWLDFHFQDHQFSINNQMGEYWFFCLEDCPLDVRESLLKSLPQQ